MSIDREGLAGSKRRMEELRRENDRLEARIEAPDVLRCFIHAGRIDRLEASRRATTGHGDDAKGELVALEQYHHALSAFVGHLEEVEREIADPVASERVFTPLQHPGGFPAPPNLLERQKADLAELLSVGATAIEVEAFGRDMGNLRNRRIALFVQARFCYAGTPMMMRYKCGAGCSLWTPTAIHYRCPAAPALHDLWVRPKRAQNALGSKSAGGHENIEIGDRDFDRVFSISGTEETAKRCLVEPHRRSLLLLNEERQHVSLSISRGTICFDAPRLLVQRSIAHVSPLLAHIYSLRGGQRLLRDVG